MATRDIFQAINELDAAGIQRVVDRLEYRGQYAPFVGMRETYLEHMDLGTGATILDLGCGTGVVARAIAARSSFHGRVVGVDFSSALLDAARRFSQEEGVTSRVEFHVGDAQKLEERDAAYDAVIVHTLVSHVSNPTAVISEAARVVRQAVPSPSLTVTMPHSPTPRVTVRSTPSWYRPFSPRSSQIHTSCAKCLPCCGKSDSASADFPPAFSLKRGKPRSLPAWRSPMRRWP